MIEFSAPSPLSIFSDSLIAARWFDEALPSVAAAEPPDPPQLPGTNAFWAARRALAVRRR